MQVLYSTFDVLVSHSILLEIFWSCLALIFLTSIQLPPGTSGLSAAAVAEAVTPVMPTLRLELVQRSSTSKIDSVQHITIKGPVAQGSLWT